MIYVIDSRIKSLCASTAATETGSLLYLKNQDYPSAIRPSETSCACSVETTDCAAQINVHFIHFGLSDGGICTDNQKIQIDDDGSVQTYTCSQNTNYSITLIMTTTTNFITITLDNSAGTNNGAFWIGLEGRHEL